MVAETLGSLLHHCSKTNAFHYGIALHAVAIKSGLQAHVFISNHILNMYSKCGNIFFATQVFDDMPQRNLVTWSALISGYVQDGKHLMAVNLYSQMLLEPNEFVLSSALTSCANLLALKLGTQIHAQSIKLGCSSISFVSNSLISMYMKNYQCRDALSVFASSSNVTAVSYNAIITGLVESNRSEKAFEVYKCMCRQGLVPDHFTFVGLLGTCDTTDGLGKGMQLHSQTIKLKLDRTAFLGNIIMTVYSNLNLPEEAEKVFRLIREKDVISWNTLIAACSHSDDHMRALVVFREMVEYFDGRPDEFTYASVLSASASIGSMHFGRQIHTRLLRTRSSVDIGVGNALVNMYAKCGSIKYGHTAFRRMTCHNLVSWNSIIAGFANHGHGREVIKLFEELKSVGLKPDAVTFLGLLIACNHAGLVDDGLDYFNNMNEIYGVIPEIEHFSCLIDLLGRSGRLEEAEEYMQRYPFGHDPVVLGCLLSACRLHGDIVTGERVAKKLLPLQPVSTSPYVLLSNLYASDKKWDNVAEARRMLKSRGIKKEAGHSLIEVKGSVEKFTIGSFSHSMIEEIMNVLGTLGCGWDEETVILDSA